MTEIDCGNYDFIDTVTNPHIIASNNIIYLDAIKRFNQNLLTPIIPFPLFEFFMETKEEHLEEVVISRIRELSEIRRKTLLILFDFFLQKVLPC